MSEDLKWKDSPLIEITDLEFNKVELRLDLRINLIELRESTIESIISDFYIFYLNH
jgi:hypothetical protein